MRNDFYIYARCPHEWQNEMKILDGTYTVVCDAYFKKDGKYQILEVDSTQKMIANKKKIDQYKGLMGGLNNDLGYSP